MAALVGVIPAGGEDMIPVDPKPLRRRVSSPLCPPPDALPPQGARAETTHPLPGAWGFFLGGGNVIFGWQPAPVGCVSSSPRHSR